MTPIEQLTHNIIQNQLWDDELELGRNEYLKVKGSIDTNLYFIESGSLRIYVVDEDEEHTIRFGYQHNIIASLDSYITEQPSEFYIQALKKTKLKVLKKSTFQGIIKVPEYQGVWAMLLEQLFLQQLERERDLLTTSPQERYRRVQERSPQLFQEIPSKYIADYLRMTPETLSRIKKA